MITFTLALTSTGLTVPSEFSSLVPVPLQYAELALDPATGDLYIPVTILKGVDAVVQRIKVRFKFFLGEWFLDQRLGIPYFQEVLIKNPDPIVISSIFREVLLTTPGVKFVREFHASLDRATRQLTVDFIAILADATVISASAEPFIIQG